MPDPDRLLSILRRAIDAYRRTPGRRGRLIELADASEVLVAGDLHGNLENLKVLLRAADLAAHPRRHLVLQEVIHGPHRYPQGGDRSHQALDVLAALKAQFPRQFHLLPGNHELAQLTGRRIGKEDSDLIEQFERGVNVAYGDRGPVVYRAYLELFTVLPLAVRTANRVFLSHSLPSGLRLDTFRPEVLARETTPAAELVPGGSVYALVWGRDTSEANARGFLERVDADWLITGHIPCPDGYAVANERQIILDSLGSPAAYVLFPADRPLQLDDLVASVHRF